MHSNCGHFITAIGSIFCFVGRIVFQALTGQKIENSSRISHKLSSCVHFITRIIIRLCFYYNNNSGLIFTNQISYENRDFMLVEGKNTLKLILSNCLRARKYLWFGFMSTAALEVSGHLFVTVYSSDTCSSDICSSETFIICHIVIHYQYYHKQGCPEGGVGWV
jgi:hypothetical protein